MTMTTIPMSRTNKGESTYRVRSLAQDQQGGDSWLGDEIRATNCDSEDCEINANVLFDDDKIPIEYTCDRFLESESELSSLSMSGETQVSIDYEALIPREADAAANERQLQWRVLLAAVKELGLDRCDFDHLQQPAVDATRRLESSNMTLTPTLYAVRSDLNSSTVLDVPCTRLKINATNQCIPVRTVLTLKYRGNDTQEKVVQETVQALLQQKMVNRTEELYVKDVEGLYYVGTFESIADDQNSTSSAVRGDSVVRIGTLISAASAVLLFITLLVFRRRNNNSNNQEFTDSINEKTPEDIQDLESAQIAPTMPTNASSESNLAASSEEESADGPSVESEIPLEGSTHSEQETLDENYNDNLQSSSSDSGERMATVEGTFPLPPRPPRRGESVQLKKTRRRRKKKKKRPTLKRVNSREHVASMEAIPETIADTSEFESGSDYSTDDDGSSYQSSSTSSTPIRTRSLPGSRSTSPSPHGFPPESISSNVDFIMEALAFPFEANCNELTSSSTSLQDTDMETNEK